MSQDHNLSTKEQVFNNDHMTLTVLKEPGCRVKFTINATPKAVALTRSLALKKINKEISIPGFRKGKAPEALIEKNFAKAIDQEWKDIALNKAFEEGLHLTDTRPLSKDSVTKASIKELSLEKGGEFLVEFEAFPKFPEIVPSTLKLPHIETEKVTDEQVTNYLQDLCLNKASWKDISDRPVQEGDYVNLTIDILGASPRTIYEKTRLHAMEKKMDRWMRRLIVGKMPGDVVEGVSEDERHLSCETEDGKCKDETHDHQPFNPVNLRIQIHTIEEPTIPTLDDELAKTYGASDLADLKDKVRTSLDNRFKQEQKTKMRAQVRKALLDQYVFDLPYSIVQSELKARSKTALKAYREDKTLDPSDLEQKKQRIESELLAVIDRELRFYFLTDYLAYANHIQVTNDEVMMQLMQERWAAGITNLENEDQEELQQEIKAIKSHILVVKILDHLLQSSAI